MKLRLKEGKYRGKLIVFEGTDGAGKTTLIKKTAEYLHKKLGWGAVLQVKQPTYLSRKTKLFQKMMYCNSHGDIDYRAVQLLTLSDRIQHQHEVILPALQAGKTVICDRYVYTSVANMESRGFVREKWFYAAAKHLLKPDLCVLAYVPWQTAIERIKARPQEAHRYFDEELLRRVAEYFLRNANKLHMQRIDTDRDAEITFLSLKDKLNRLYGDQI